MQQRLRNDVRWAYAIIQSSHIEASTFVKLVLVLNRSVICVRRLYREQDDGCNRQRHDRSGKSLHGPFPLPAALSAAV